MLKKFFLFLIFSLLIVSVVVLRFYKLGSIPQGLNIDEASYGYDAFSLMKTGKDMWGRAWPITLKSFGDYKPATLSYAIIPFIKIFNLSSLSVRLPSAIAGLLTLVVLYYILQTIKNKPILNLCLVCIYALSPWSFGLSRLFYEPNVGLLFFTLGFLFSLKYFQTKNDKYFLLSAGFIAFSGLWYVALRVTGGLYLASLLLIKVYQDRKISSKLALPVLYIVIFFLPIVLITFNKEGLTRLKQESVGQNYSASLFIDENRAMCYLSSGKNALAGKLCVIWWNKPVQRLEHVSQSLLYQLGINYLFIDQTQPDVVAKYFGPYLWVLIPVYALGFFALLQQTFDKKKGTFFTLPIISAILVGNLPAAVAGSPQLHRNVVGLFMAFIVLSLGAFLLLDLVKPKLLRYLVTIVILSGVTFQTTQYLVYYFAVYTKLNHLLWRYDSPELFSFASSKADSYNRLWFQGFEDAPLYYAFYSKMDPQAFQSQVVHPDSGDWIHSASVGKVESVASDITSLLCKARNLPGNTLIVMTDSSPVSKTAIYRTRDFTDVHTIHEVYDATISLNELQKEGWNPVKACPK